MQLNASLHGSEFCPPSLTLEVHYEGITESLYEMITARKSVHLDTGLLFKNRLKHCIPILNDLFTVFKL